MGDAVHFERGADSSGRRRHIPPVEAVVLAPLHWLERSRGWRRRGLILLYMAIVLLAAGSVWWAASLNGLPDPGDPFDVADFRASIAVPPEEDAFTLYREAFEAISSDPVTNDPNRIRGDAVAGWAQASPEARERAERYRAVLDPWRLGSRRDRAQVVPAGQFQLLGAGDGLPLAMSLFDLSLMGILEATRLEDAGDLAGAWEHYRAALRASRHVGMGGTSSHRSIGQVLASIATTHVLRWSEHPNLDAALLRQALDDARDIEALSPPHSATLKADFLGMIEAVEHPDSWLEFDQGAQRPGLKGTFYALCMEWSTLFRMATFLKREPERSRRVYRIMYAHWLSQCDLPPGRRIPMVKTQTRNNHTFPDFPYTTPPGGLDAAHPLSTDDYHDWFRSTLYADFLCPPLGHYLENLDRDRRGLSTLVLHLAERLYTLDRGSPPERNEDLVASGYLERLPDGYESTPVAR